MGSSSSLISRVGIDSPSLKTPTNKNKTEVYPEYVKARSLRPNLWLSEACLEGNEEAKAIRDAWQFQTSRATRIITLTNEHGILATKDEVADYSETTFSYSDTGSWYSEKRIKLFPRVAESNDAVCERLNKAHILYKNNPAEGKQFWEAVLAFACLVVHEDKQYDMRMAGRKDDLANGFMTRVVEKLEQYAGPEPFANWMRTVFRNYAVDCFKELIDEKKRKLVEMPTMAADGDDDSAPDAAEEQVADEWILNQQTANRLSFWTDERLRELPKADQEYAAFVMQGLNQKQAAVRMEESVVTARKRQRRIFAALDVAEVAK